MAVAVAPVLAWRLADVLLLAFGAVLVAALIDLVAEPLTRHTPTPRWLAVSHAVDTSIFVTATGERILALTASIFEAVIAPDHQRRLPGGAAAHLR